MPVEGRPIYTSIVPVTVMQPNSSKPPCVHAHDLLLLTYTQTWHPVLGLKVDPAFARFFGGYRAWYLATFFAWYFAEYPVRGGATLPLERLIHSDSCQQPPATDYCRYSAGGQEVIQVRVKTWGPTILALSRS